ncbi:MAG TPA: hypothetical protein VEA41_06710 [Salinarimonas sp.]|nr:hypothetical protein [Salinarimonas sp.]
MVGSQPLPTIIGMRQNPSGPDRTDGAALIGRSALLTLPIEAKIGPRHGA